MYYYYMNNLTLGATQYKSLKNKAVTGIETTWTLKENNKTARAAPPKTIFQNVHTEVFVEPRGQAGDKISYSYSEAWKWNLAGKSSNKQDHLVILTDSLWHEGVGTKGTYETHLVAWVELGTPDILTAIGTEIEYKPDIKGDGYGQEAITYSNRPYQEGTLGVEPWGNLKGKYVTRSIPNDTRIIIRHCKMTWDATNASSPEVARRTVPTLEFYLLQEAVHNSTAKRRVMRDIQKNMRANRFIPETVSVARLHNIRGNVNPRPQVTPQVTREVIDLSQESDSDTII